MGMAQWATVAFVLVAPNAGGFEHRGVILAQGTDKLPGGVEHVPTPGGGLMPPPMPAPSVAAPTPPMPDAAAVPAEIPQTAPAAPDSTTAKPETDSEKPAETKSKKSKKAAPAGKKDGLLRSIKPGSEDAPATDTGGDDRQPGGVEHAPSTPHQ